MAPSELDREILEFPLPGRLLARPDNALFLVKGIGTAFRLFFLLPFRKLESLYPSMKRRRAESIDLEKAAISYSLTEKLLRSPLFPFRRTCLRRCLLMANLLRQSGVEVEICFGVRDRKGGLAGHSWLVRSGTPFLETEGSWQEYTCVFTLPRPG